MESSTAINVLWVKGHGSQRQLNGDNDIDHLAPEPLVLSTVLFPGGWGERWR
jgi:hypothetical protein